jgi:hypothetical protein
VTPEGTLTGDQLQRLTSCLRTVALGCREASASVAAVAGLRDPHFQHDPTGLPEVTQHVDAMSKAHSLAAQVEEAAEPPVFGARTGRPDHRRAGHGEQARSARPEASVTAWRVGTLTSGGCLRDAGAPAAEPRPWIVAGWLAALGCRAAARASRPGRRSSQALARREDRRTQRAGRQNGDRWCQP